MCARVPKICDLSLDVQKIDTTDCLKYLPHLVNVAQNENEAAQLLAHIAVIVQKEISEHKSICGNAISANHCLFNLAFRCYYQVRRNYQLQDEHYGWLAKGNYDHRQPYDFCMLYAVLLMKDATLLPDIEKLKQQCLEALTLAIKGNHNSKLAILKVLNLLCKQHSALVIEWPLDEVYACMANNMPGLREETLVLFKHCCRRSDRACAYFQLIVNFWPWTNRNKLYLLSCILNSHQLVPLLQASDVNVDEFFAGLRISLKHKSLFAASQYLIKSLSSQQSEELLELSANVLTFGSFQELQSFHAQWFSRITNIDSLFVLLQAKPDIAQFLLNIDAITALQPTDQYRFVLIFSLFTKQILNASKMHFFKISTEFITNCFKYDLSAQMLIFKFITDSFDNFAIEDCLDFILSFIKQHKDVENAQFRNGILSRLPNIINFIAKSYVRMQDAGEHCTLSHSIRHFFQQLHALIDAHLASAVYQPKIFSLKLLEVLTKSLYAEQLERNCKNCCTAHNQQLGAFLKTEQIFESLPTSQQLLKALSDPQCFDDAAELMVVLLKLLQQVKASDIFSHCQDYCQHLTVDECSLATLYAKVLLNANDARDMKLPLFNYAFDSLRLHFETFQADAFLCCQTKAHLFGFVNVINELLLAGIDFNALPVPAAELVELLNQILECILKMLNLANAQKSHEEMDSFAAASFQDMDQSLQLIVKKSALQSDNYEESQKFLLLSFWLTLKACADLATTIGCLLVSSSEDCAKHLTVLEQCLNINVAVLTRCRHKGAIEAAGLSIGKLTTYITKKLLPYTRAYQLLQERLQSLLQVNSKQVSTTRRGAGFSLMFLHIVKNEQKPQRPLLRNSMTDILKCLEGKSDEAMHNESSSSNCDRVEALALHYLCVLVKDTELREAMSTYYSEIIMTGITQIDNSDWTICNAALQLFGALLPKIVGQKQSAAETEESLNWHTSEVTFDEIQRMLPHTLDYMLDYCVKYQHNSSNTRSILLFLCFLAKVEHLRKQLTDETCEILLKMRELMWSLLQHSCEQVRKLAAVCFVRTHELRCELPNALLAISKLLFSVQNENFFQGLVLTMLNGLAKLSYEAKHTLCFVEYLRLMHMLQQQLSDNLAELHNSKFKLYTLSKFLELVRTIGITPVMTHSLEFELKQGDQQNIGVKLWKDELEKLKEFDCSNFNKINLRDFA